MQGYSDDHNLSLAGIESDIHDIFSKVAGVFGYEDSQKLLDLYKKRNFQELAKYNLKKPVDQEGNTIIHLMAANLDLDGFKALKKDNAASLTPDVINLVNKNGETPLNKAMQSLRKYPSDHSIIDYLKEKLGANPNIADKEGYIIKTESEANDVQNKYNDKIKQLNNTVIENIKKISNSDIKPAYTLTSYGGNSCGSNNNGGMNVNTYNKEHIDFVIKLLDQTTDKQAGGYHGKRKIKNFYSELTENGDNDSFVSSKKNQLLDEMEGGKRKIKKFEDKWKTDDFEFSNKKTPKVDYSEEPLKSDSEMTQERPRRKRNEKVDEIYRSFVKKIMDHLGVDEKTAKTYRSAIKIVIKRQNPELKKPENDGLMTHEMEKIIEDKKKLKNFIEKIDMNEMEKYMQEQKENAEKRKQEFMKNREQQKKLTETQTSDDKTKKSKKTKKVEENGYLQSDEILLSSSY